MTERRARHKNATFSDVHRWPIRDQQQTTTSVWLVSEISEGDDISTPIWKTVIWEHLNCKDVPRTINTEFSELVIFSKIVIAIWSYLIFEYLLISPKLINSLFIATQKQLSFSFWLQCKGPKVGCNTSLWRSSRPGGAFEPTGFPVQINFAWFLESFERLDFGLEVPNPMQKPL